MEALGINLGLLIVQLIAFTIVMLTLNAWVYQPMLNMMETRKQKIAQGLEDARVARAVAIGLGHFSEPPAPRRLGECDRADQRRRDPLLRRDARVEPHQAG